MTRSDLIRAVAARGGRARPWQVDRARESGVLEPAPERVGDRLIYSQAHVEQLLAYVRGIDQRRRVRALVREEAARA